MNDLTKWLPLWEKCPELRPHLEYHDGVWVMGFGEYSSKVTTTTEEIAAALIGWKAVTWLATEHLVHLVHRNYGTQEEWIAREGPDSDGVCEQVAFHPDPLEALRLAVCRVLNVEP